MKRKKVLSILLSSVMLMSVTSGSIFASDEVGVEVITDVEDLSDGSETENEGETDIQDDVDVVEGPDVQDDNEIVDAEQENTIFSDGTAIETRTITASGDVNSRITWVLYSDGELVLNGSGSMPDYLLGRDVAPWSAYCDSIKKVSIQEGIKSIGDEAFCGCVNMTEIKIPEDVDYIGLDAFCGCKSLTDIKLPDKITEVHDGAFEGCTGLRKIEIPEGVMGIGGFQGCTNLEYVKFPETLEIIGPNAFRNCSKLNNVKFPEKLTLIWSGAFADCTSLTSIEIPKNVTEIKWETFWGCKSLESVNILNSATIFGKNVFTKCTGLRTVRYSGTKEQWDALNLNIKNATIYYNYDPTHEHSYILKVTKASSCTEKGKGEETCKICGDQYETEIPALGHDLDQGVVSKEANCIEEGIITYSCQRDGCGYKEEKFIPTNQKHVYGNVSCKWSEDNSECMASEVCSLCKYEDTETVKTQEKIVEQATCTRDGKTQYTAAFSNSNFQTQNKEVIVPQSGHKNTEVRYAKEATCERDGYTGDVYCKDCGELLADGNIIRAIGHRWDNGVIEKKPTCTEKGQKVYTCFRCNATKTEKLETVEHKWNDKETTDLKPTCTTSGRKSIHCNVCDEIKEDSQQIIPATGHKFSSWKTTSQATVFAQAQQSRFCGVCGKKETRKVGNKVKPTIKSSVTSIILKTKQKTTAVRISGLAKGDSIVSWKANNTSVAKVSGKSNGTCTITAGNKKGRAVITVTLKSGLKKNIPVTVQTTVVKTTKITGIPSKINLKRNQSTTLRPILSPITSGEKVTYKTGNIKIATVSSKGQIKARGKGTTIITVTSGKKSVKCKITVR